jgi:hypothetical protein
MKNKEWVSKPGQIIHWAGHRFLILSEPITTFSGQHVLLFDLYRCKVVSKKISFLKYYNEIIK